MLSLPFLWLCYSIFDEFLEILSMILNEYQNLLRVKYFACMNDPTSDRGGSRSVFGSTIYQRLGSLIKVSFGNVFLCNQNAGLRSPFH